MTLTGVCVCVVPGVRHPAAVREPSSQPEPGGVRVRSSVPLHRHHPDLPLLAADHRQQLRLNPHTLTLTHSLRVECV